MTNARRYNTALTALALAMAGIFFPRQATAQQRIPQAVPSPRTAIPQPGLSLDQMIPGENLGDGFKAQDVPKANQGRTLQRTPFILAPGAGTVQPDPCSFADVDSAELDAARSAILELLSGNEAARKSFLTSEGNLQPNCPRQKASFYLKAIARIKASK
jgi:hypothetical protein